MIIYKIQAVNYKVRSEVQELAYFAKESDAIERAFQYVADKKGENPSLCKPNLEQFKFYTHVGYISYYGSYDCGVEIIPIDVQ